MIQGKNMKKTLLGLALITSLGFSKELNYSPQIENVNVKHYGIDEIKSCNEESRFVNN